MAEYVCGFAFDVAREWVVLIQKRRPAWQRGLWNGVGGHLEPEDLALETQLDTTAQQHAMGREFREETGLKTKYIDWSEFLILQGPGWKVHFLRSFGIDVNECKTATDEEVRAFPTYLLPMAVVPNLHWLIPLAAQDEYKPVHGPRPFHVIQHAPKVEG